MLPGSKGIDNLTRSVLAVHESVGHVDPPFRKGSIQRRQPLADSRLTGIDLLSAAHETNDHRPVLVPVEAGDQELWLGLLEVRATLLLPHEVNRLLQVPGPLGFIEDGHVLDWRAAQHAARRWPFFPLTE
jgi:hypothetical protein